MKPMLIKLFVIEGDCILSLYFSPGHRTHLPDRYHIKDTTQPLKHTVTNQSPSTQKPDVCP